MAEQIFEIGIKAIARNSTGDVLIVNFVRADGSMHMWDLPGGRMDAGEDFLQTLSRELQEEIGSDYVGAPRHKMTILSNATIPVEGKDIPLVLIAYEVSLVSYENVQAVESGMILEWVSPTIAAERLTTKYPAEFCAMIGAI